MSTPNCTLSICLPTYNRLTSLELLLVDLCDILDGYSRDVELCVSDNCSTDGTKAALHVLNGRENVRIIRQDTNIGGSRNVVFVMRMAVGKWALVIGDDDRLDRRKLSKLLVLLNDVDPKSWIFLHASQANVSEKFFSRPVDGPIGSRELRLRLLLNGTASLGFVGVHLIPQWAIKNTYRFSDEALRIWPHILLMADHLHSGNRFAMCNIRLICQSASGILVHWPIEHFVHMELKKIEIFRILIRKNGGWGIFFNMMILREVYSQYNIAFMISWKRKNEASFKKEIFKTYWNIYRQSRALAAFFVPHLLLLTLIWVMGNKLIEKFLPKRIIAKMDELNARDETLGSASNGIIRGV